MLGISARERGSEAQYQQIRAVQVEYLLGAAAAAAGSSAKLAVLGVVPVPVCGNGACELGERPVANTSSSIGTAGLLLNLLTTSLVADGSCIADALTTAIRNPSA